MFIANTNLSGFVPNQHIPDDTFETKEFERLVRIKAVREVDRAEVTVAVEEEIEEEPIPRGLWTFDAEELVDLTIDQLNMRAAQYVLDHGLAELEPFADEEEAILWMTSDNTED